MGVDAIGRPATLTCRQLPFDRLPQTMPALDIGAGIVKM
jgi:hypothetical protein